MCLGTPLKDQKRAIQRMTNKQGYIRVWKKVEQWTDTENYMPCWRGGIHKSGLCKAKRQGERLHAKTWGFHALRSKTSAKRYPSGNTIIECLALPKWVRFVGCDDYFNPNLKTVTFTHLFFPTFPNRKPKVKDFWKAIKEAKP